MEGRSQTQGSVVLQISALELIARYSMNSGRHTSMLSSLHEFRMHEAEQSGSKEWNWKYLRDQFDQKELEGLYRKYDDKLKESLIYIYISLLVLFSTTHMVLVVVSTYRELVQWHSTYLSMAMYILRIAVPSLFLWKGFYEPMKQKYFWMPIFVTFVITLDLVVTDIAVAVYSSVEGVALRPAYATIALLSLYIFLPIRNNFITIIFGLIVSFMYVMILAFFTYIEDPQIGVVVASDIIYLIGANLMGTYFRLMNEIVTRRSFLDRRACVESTLRLKFVKDQEERLMLSILPEHIMSKVRQDIRTMYLGIQNRSMSNAMKSFNRLYVEEHENVSILYADVVNYTMISTTLAPEKMVELLNELFGRFDEASEEHDVLRIKFLGDCYYSVSGIPKPNPQHAKCCVDLGLEMIHIIKDVREKRSLPIDMRIGVHSGRILSGIIGIRKWQFDIWSKDVTIANKMESTGKPGKVHVTQQTLEELLSYAREYIIEPNFDSQNDPFIIKNKLETYLISRPARTGVEYKPFRRASVGLNKIIKKQPTSGRRSDNRNPSLRRTTAFMDDNLVEYQQMLKAADAQMAKEIDEMTNGKEHFKKESKLNRWTLMYKDFALEKSYLVLPDPLFKYYISCCLIIFLLISLINGLTTKWFNGFQWYTWTIFALLLFYLIVMQPLTWFQFLWTKHRGIEEPRNKILRWVYDSSAHIIRSVKLRTTMYLLISIGLAASSVVNVIGCLEVDVNNTETVLSNCVSSWHVTQCWSLALLLNFLFSRVFFIFKWIVAGGMTIFYLYVVWEIKSALFAQDATWNVGLDPRVAHTLAVVFVTITLYWIDRTTEFRNRLDHLWQMQLKEEQSKAETTLKVNNMLLENILPAHVVQVYLDLNRPIDELYYEKFDNVAVMFASLTDYKLGVDNDGESNDKLMLSILDEVISDFDRLLLSGTSTHKIEKIKMAGWTYMAACGLDPNRRESFDSSYSVLTDQRQNTPYNRAIVLTMVEFAAAMMMQLQNFNKGSFQSFEGLNLRIGISNGNVAAGVVGSLKPLYDIWGHAVNMASRMDSTGETGKIQVTEKTAIILDECGILTTYRGQTFVKGAGYIRTYFVPLDEHFNLIRKENSLEFYRTEDRNRYYNVKNALMNDLPTGTEELDTELQGSIYNIRDISVDGDDDHSDEYTPSDKSDCSDNEENTRSSVSDDVLSSTHINVTQC